MVRLDSNGCGGRLGRSYLASAKRRTCCRAIARHRHCRRGRNDVGRKAWSLESSGESNAYGRCDEAVSGSRESSQHFIPRRIRAIADFFYFSPSLTPLVSLPFASLVFCRPSQRSENGSTIDPPNAKVVQHHFGSKENHQDSWCVQHFSFHHRCRRCAMREAEKAQSGMVDCRIRTVEESRRRTGMARAA